MHVHVSWTVSWLNVFLASTSLLVKGKYSGVGGVAYDKAGKMFGIFQWEDWPQFSADHQAWGPRNHHLWTGNHSCCSACHQLLCEREESCHFCTGNQAAQTCFVECKSTNNHMNLVIRAACSLEESLGLVAWIERVLWQSNPSDFFSREEVAEWQELTACPIDLTELWESCLQERLGFACGGSARDLTAEMRFAPTVKKSGSAGECVVLFWPFRSLVTCAIACSHSCSNATQREHVRQTTRREIKM